MYGPGSRPVQKGLFMISRSDRRDFSRWFLAVRPSLLP